MTMTTTDRTYLDRALALAAGGWPVFPVDATKRPYRGFTDWENRASTDPAVLTAWWSPPDRGGYGADALPAVTPGRVKRVCIDVDRHPGKPDGYLSLVRIPVHIPDRVPCYPSLSGAGLHYWYRGTTTSKNSLYPGVDRKAIGGYVVASYDLAPVNEVTVPVPVPFHGSTRIDPDQVHPCKIPPADWLRAHAGSTPSPAVRHAVKTWEAGNFTGHENLLRLQAWLVHLGREGHGGVPEALEKARVAWLNSTHASAEDPGREWVTALTRAIGKFGGEE